MKRPQWIRAAAVTLAMTAALAVAAVDRARPAAASDNGQSIRPAMGWSSWSFVRRSPTEANSRLVPTQANVGARSRHFALRCLGERWSFGFE